MTDEEQYRVILKDGINGLCSIQDTHSPIPRFYNDLGYVWSVQPLCDLLNEKSAENQQLKKQIKELKEDLNKKIKGIGRTIDENTTEVNTDEFIRLCQEINELRDKCEHYRQALVDLGVNVKILDGEEE